MTTSPPDNLARRLVPIMDAMNVALNGWARPDHPEFVCMVMAWPLAGGEAKVVLNGVPDPVGMRANIGKAIETLQSTLDELDNAH